MRIERTKAEEMVLVRLDPGDDLLLSIRRAIREAGIENGWIVNGVGSVTSHHFHVVSSRVNPPEETYVKAQVPADVIGMSGMILDGRVHAHITFANDKLAYGGHLEEGAKVLTFFAMTILPLSLQMRNWDCIGPLDETGAQGI